jgi:uncharacterized repeat protein (TIGR02543 family)
MHFAAKMAIFRRNVRRSLHHFLALVIAVSTLSAISVVAPQVAAADTAGTGNCVQTFTKTGTGQVDVFETGGFCYVAFKNTGAVDTNASYTWTRPAALNSVDVLVVGGGGSGGARHGGGGGAGGFVQTDGFSISTASTVSIVVGSGGSGSTEYLGVDGRRSSFKSSTNGLTALGGGAGANWPTAGAGGSGGGAGANQTPGGVSGTGQTNFAGTSLSDISFGSSGAAGASDSNSGSDNNDYWAGGGGGGAGAAGAMPTSNGTLVSALTPANTFPTGSSATAVAGKGGDGRSVSWITSSIAAANALNIGHTVSSTVYFAGGGGGGMGADGQAGGAGGLGGGATGTRIETTGNAGMAFTGGGGGGSGFDDINKAGSTTTVSAADAGDGGSGIVVLRYRVQPGAPTITGITGGDNSLSVAFTAPTDGSTVTGYKFSTNGGSAWSASTGSTSSPISITGLTNGTSYPVQIRAVNTYWDGVATASTTAVAGTVCSPTSASANGYTSLTFTSTTVCNWSVPAGVTAADVLVVGGGGGGGADGGGGGGGGGVFQNSNFSITPNSSVVVKVGAGGAGGQGYKNSLGNCTNGFGGWSSNVVGCDGARGQESSFSTLAVTGGGGGGGIESNGTADSVAIANARGGGGGGGAQNDYTGASFGGVGGFTGGSVTNTAGNAGGGGAGAGASGSASSGSSAGAGGAGVTATINSIVYGSGGGGGSYNNASAALGGANAASGGSQSAAPTTPIANRGGGGGGGGNGNTIGNAIGSSGADGVVIVRYVNPPAISLSSSSISATIASAVISYTISNSSGPAASYAISPALTSNGTLSFSTSTGLISGTPTATLASTNYTITATNSSGTSTATFSLAINHPTCSPTENPSPPAGFTVLTFTNTTTCNWSVPAGVTAAEILVVGGGGGAGSGGGGAGGFLSESRTGLSGVIQIVVGSGGAQSAGQNLRGANGGTSSFGDRSAGGGGGGGRGTAAIGSDAPTGATQRGSGGGASSNGSAGKSAGATRGGDTNDGRNIGGGGGGAGADGVGNNSGAISGNGGVGLQSSISGTSTYYAGGGRAAGGSSGGLGHDKPGGGGSNTGSTAGQDGVVIVRYANSLTITYDTQSGSGIASGSTTTGGSISTSPGTPTRSGFTFNGWFAASTGGSAITFPYTHNQTANFTLYAQWSQIVNGSMVFGANANSYLTIPNSAGLKFGTGHFTVEWWQYQTDSQLYPRVFESMAATTREIGVSIESNTFYWWSGGSALCRQDLGTGNKNAWLHFAVSRSGSTTKVFKNGTEICSFTDSKDYQPTGVLKIGSELLAGANTYFGGNITNFHWVKGTALYTANFTKNLTPTTTNANSILLLNSQNQSTFITDLTGLNTVTNNGNNVTWSTMSPFGASTVATLSALSLSTGTLSPTFASGTTSYTASVSNATSSITVTPTVTQANATIQAKVGSGSFASVTSASASGSLALAVGSNTITVLVTAQDGTTTASYTVTVTRGVASQTITFGSLNNKTLGSGTYAVSATASSSLAVTLTSATTLVCTISSGTITLVSAGTCTINANQAGDSSYAAATQVQQSFTVSTALSITTPSGSGLQGTYNTAFTSLTVASSGGAGTNSFSATGSLPTGVTLSSAGVISGTPTIAGDFSLTVTVTDANGTTATTSSFTISIAKGVSSISISAPAYTFTGSPQGPDSVTTSGSAGAVTYAYAGRGSTTYASSSTKPTNVGTYTVTATLAADSNFASVSATADFAITAGSALIPAFGSTTATTTGFTVQISNYSPSYTWGGSATASGSVAISDTGLVTVTGVAPGTSSTATITTTRTGYTGGSATVSATSISCADGGLCIVGDTGPGGGIVFYVAPSGGTFACGQSLSSTCKYLEAAPITGASAWTDTRYAWSGNTNTAIGTTSTAIGTGYSNTLKMVRQSGAGTAGAGSAARNYRGGGLNDWYLPSKDELNQLYINRTVASASDGYWSSSEYNATGAWDQGFGNGSQGVADPGKHQTTPVRPIRAFGSSAVESAIIYVPAIAGVTAPVRGATPVTTVTAANGYTGTVTWSSSPSTFAAATTYTATITLTASSGFTLTGVTANFFTVSGATSVTHLANSGSITAEFPATEASPALTPAFGSTTATATGFTVQISNYSSDYTWGGSATASGSVAISDTGLVTVTGVAPGTSSTATITTTRTGYTGGSATVSATSTSSNVATLSALTLTTATLSPNFASGTTSYTVSVANGTTSITVTPTRTQANATITVNGTAVTSGSASGSISLNVGSNTITVVVTAQDGTTTSTYTVTVSRALETYTITLAAGTNGTGSDQTFTKTNGTNLTLPDSATANGYFTWTGYTVSGWSTSNGGSQTHALGGSFTTEAATTLYPVWADIPAAVYFLADDYTAGSTTWTERIANAAGTTATGGMTKGTSPASVVFAGKESSNSDRLVGSIGSTTDLSAVTVEMWVRLGDNGSTQNASGSMLFSWSANAGTANYNIYHQGGKLGFNTFASELYGINSSTHEQIWRHYVFVMSTGAVTTQKIYVNGILQTLSYQINTAMGTRAFNSSGNFVVMDNPYTANTWNAKGNLGLLRVYKGELIASQAASLYDATKSTYEFLTLTYDSQGGTSVSAASTAVGGSIATAPTPPTRTGYTFAGWSTTSSGSAVSFTGGYTHGQSSDFTLYAIWTANSLAVTYDSQGGTSVSSGTVATNAKISAAPTAPTRAGYTFSGWSTTTTGSVVSFTGGYTHGQSADFTLYAIWTANSLVVTYDAQGGSSVTAGSVATDAKISAAPTPPTRTGYTLSGWSTTTTGSVVSFTGGYTHGKTEDFTLYAIWTINTYAIVFDANGGTGSMGNQSFTYSVAVNLNANLYSRANYVFHRWATNADGTGTTYNNLAQVTLTAGVTLYAQWTANTYVVTFNYNNATGGNSTTTSSFTTGGPAMILPTPTKAGFNFAGWYPDAALLLTTVGAAGAEYRPTGATLSVTIYAKWTAIDYTFTYDANSADTGAVPTETSKQITQTATVKANTGALVRIGYTFGGWNTQSNGSGDNYLSGSLFTVAAANVTLYAKWNANTYTVTYNSNGGSGNAQRTVNLVATNIESDSYTTGSSSVTLPNVGTLARSGYTFGGWNTSAAGTGTNRLATATYTTVSNVILYAKWNPVTYSITYDGNSNTGGTTPTTGGYTTGQASPYSVLANSFTKTSNVFGGWNTASGGTGTSYSPGASITTLADIVLYAIWIPQYTLHYAINGGSVTSGSLPISALYDTGTLVGSIFSAVERTGYNFGGWSNGSTTIAGGGSFRIVEDSVLTAIWTPKNYTISYDSDGGSDAPNSFTKQIGQSYTVGSAVFKPGYNFAGWSNGSSVIGADAVMVMGSSNVSYTAQWAAKVFTISYDWNGGRGTAVSDVNYTFGTNAITLPLVGDRVKDGYTFAGWSESLNGGSALSATYIPSQTRTLYALWNIGNFTVTYDPGRGTVANTTVAVQNGGSTVLPLPTRSNFVFDGWHTSVNGGSSIGSNGVSFTPLASQTVYARWIQSSLYGITNSLTRIGSVVTADNLANTFSGANSNSSVAVSVPANALPAGTTINFDLVGNSSRATGLLANINYIVSIAISWLTGNETVPDTNPEKPISVTISNATIKKGAVAYAIVNNASTLLGTATQDGTITVAITADPEVVVVATRPNAPTSVSATSNGNQQSVVTWSAPTSDGGSAITGYTVTASPSVTAPLGCTSTTNLSCTFTGLTDGTAYTFTVTATNSVGTSAASSSASATTAAIHSVAFNAKGGSNVTSGSFLTASDVTEPTAPTRTGYTFAGWSATDGGTALTFPYTPGVANNITLFARWDALNKQVTFDSKSGSAVANGVFASGGTVSAPTPPTRSGFTFAGWSATDGGTAVTFPYTPNVVTDITLYAKWTVVSQGGGSGGSSGSGGGSSTPTPSVPSTPTVPVVPITPVKGNVTVVAAITVVGNKDAKVIAVDISIPTPGSNTKLPVIKVDKASEKFIADAKVVEGKLILTPEIGFSGRRTVLVTITENGADRIIQIPLTVLPEAVTKPILTPTASNKSVIRWTESQNADGYTVYLNGKKVCTTTALSCSLKGVLGPNAEIEIVSNGGDRTVSQRVDAEFKQNTPVVVTRLVSATITKTALSKVDTKALDKVVALIKNQGFGTVVISEITTTSRTKALAAARIESIKKYITSRIGTEEVEFEVTPVKSRTYFNNIAVKG